MNIGSKVLVSLSMVLAAAAGDVSCEPQDTQPPVDTPPVTHPAPPYGGQEKTVRLTGYSWQDNTPPGSATISMPVIHQKAGGSGTFADPITAASPGHAPKTETPKGTKFYVPSLKRYFIVEDSGATKTSNTHFDLWVGGEGFSKSSSDKCMDSFTGNVKVIMNPPDGEPVTEGPLTGPDGCVI